MIPDKFNMVDMGGIDIIESQGVAVSGLYQKLVDSITQCRYQCLYNWFFNGIVIPPTYVNMSVVDDEVKINSLISVTSEDVVVIHSLEVAIIEELIVTENGDYLAPEGVDGFNPVSVNVQPTLESITINENGIYYPSQGVDGFNIVTANVSGTLSGENPPSEDLGNIGDYYIQKFPVQPTGIYGITITKAARDDDTAFTFWGFKALKFIFEDTQGNEVDFNTFTGAAGYVSYGGSSFSSNSKVLAENPSSYNEWDGLPGKIKIIGTVPSGYKPKRLEVYARSDSRWHDYWYTFNFAMWDVDNNILQKYLQVDTSEYSDWVFNGYTSFDLNNTGSVYSYKLYQKTLTGWVQIL